MKLKSTVLRLSALILLAAMLISFVACSSCQQTEDPGSTTTPGGQGDITVPEEKPVQTITPPVEHLVTNGLHKVNVTETENAFVQNDKTDYKLVSRNDAGCLTAANFIASHIFAATGTPIETVVYSDELIWDSTQKWIVVDEDTLFAAAGLKAPEEDLGKSGYYIKSVGNSVFLYANSRDGIQYAAITFLKHLVGINVISSDITVYEKENAGKTLPNFDIVERPDFDFRQQGNRVDQSTLYAMGFSTDQIFIPVEGENWHNSLNYIPPAQYKSAHPDWYSTQGNEICYTVRGNEAEYAVLVQTLADKIIGYAEANPNTPNITLTIEDHMNKCGCDACAESRAKYNGADSAAVIKLINAINAKVQAHFQSKADEAGSEKRDFTILFFAYNAMEKPPVTKDANGKYVPIDDSVICDDGVGVFIAPIFAAYNQSFYHDDNKSAAATVEGWGVLSNKLFLWTYETNYAYYLYPLNSYDTMIETQRFLKANNAIYLFSEGQYNQGNVTHFSKLKEYMNSRTMFNVNDDYADIVDDFFKYYFRDAEKPMRQYFDELNAHLRYLEEVYPATVNGNIYNNMEVSEYWPKGLLDQWLRYIDEAYEAIEYLKEEDPELYAILEKNINLESIFPRFASIRLYPGKFSAQTLDTMRKEFVADCRKLNITMLNEPSPLAPIFADWGYQ